MPIANDVDEPRLKRLAALQDSHNTDGGEVEIREDILEDGVHLAIEQSAEVLVLEDRPDLGPLGGVAATLRF